MSIAVPSVLRRWLVPASAALAVIGGGVAIGVITAAADRALPPRSAEDLLVDALNSRPDGLQGTVAVRADLGLPPLPIPTAGSADLSSLVTGTHTLRVWYSSPDHARLALLGREGETDVITNGTDLWVWSSKENTAVHSRLPENGSWLGDLLGGEGTPIPGASIPGLPSAAASALPGGLSLDPQTLVHLALTFLEPSTEITTDSSASVAGRSAYEVVLRPKDPGTLIESIVLDVDAEQNFPLRFAVYARGGGAPAIEVAFTEISFDRPDESQFTFNPPPGATVVEEPSLTDSPTDSAAPSESPTDSPSTEGSDTPEFDLAGSGWSTVLVLAIPEGFDTDTEGPAEILAHLPQVSGDWGSGRLLSTRLFSVLITDDGRLLAGAVAPERLYEAAKG